MPTVSRRLPARPHLDVPKREARELLEACREGDPDALDRIRRRHPKFKDASDDAAITAHFKLSDAQLTIAREYAFSTWAELKQRIAAETAKEARASLRKFLDWIANPHWHEARNVNAAEWGRSFPEKKWVNDEALQLLDEAAGPTPPA